MRIAIMQPYFMPYLGYFQGIAAVDKYILYDQVAYIVKGWVNRNRIRQRNMPPMYISVPIAQKSSYELIADTRIDNTQDWRRRLLKCLQIGYAKADYYVEVMPLMEEIFGREYESISELNGQSILRICKFLDIKTEIITDCTPYLEIERGLAKVEEGDYSAFPEMEKTRPSKMAARVIALCQKEGANELINAIGGTELYDKTEFAQYGIKLDFIKTNDIRYSQKCKNDSYESNMSIIDVLMHNGKEGTKKLLNQYTLV